MLHTELLRLINSRETWAFIGSGASIDAGCATWDRLLSDLEAFVPAETTIQLQNDPIFLSAKERNDLPLAFSSGQAIAGRDRLEESIRTSLESCSTPGPLHRLLADLPFAGYITTNYDGLLERALNNLDPGWAPVGNVGDEVRKASGTAERVVWHIHGAVALPSSRSHLVVTQDDYDQLYLDESPVIQQLKGLLAHRRIVIVGFGFRDADVVGLLRRVGRLTDPTRPIFALVEKTKQFRHTIDRQVFLRQYKVDVQPYRNEDGRHQNLRHTLSVYHSLSLRRTLKFGRTYREPPSYDPETTGLLIYNDLVLKAQLDVPQTLRTSILRARILSLCEQSTRSYDQLVADLGDLLDVLTRRIGSTAAKAEATIALDSALRELQESGLLSMSAEKSYALTEAGHETVLDHAAASERLEEQFDAAIIERVERQAALLGIESERPAGVVSSFFRQAIARRALGVALAFATGGSPTQQDYHALALLQSLGDWLETAQDEREALAVVLSIQEIFRAPTDAESAYIATAVQGRFILHVLSLDDDTLAVRLRELRNSLYVVDSSTLIPWMAINSSGHSAADALMRRLHDGGASVATTVLLTEELAEHARWAQRVFDDAEGVLTLSVLEAATGRAGIKTNAFLEGYLSLYSERAAPASFDHYLARCLGLASVSDPITDHELKSALENRGVAVVDFDTLATSDRSLRTDRDSSMPRVRERREVAGSFTHERQVRAEAEAMVLVEKARAGQPLIEGASSNAYFVSYTSLLNEISRSATPITLRPEALLSWLATLRPIPSEDIQAMMAELLWELQERRMNLVDQESLLRVFGPLVAAARERLDEELAKYQVLMAMRYSQDTPAPSPVPDLDAPVVLDAALYGRVEELEKQLALRTAELEAAEQKAALTEKEREELERARRKERRRTRYERQQERWRRGRPKG